MPTITVAAFAGAIPRISSQLLESQNARDCVNCDLDSGALRALHGPEKVLALPDPAGTIFKHDTDGWLHWPGEVSVVKSAVLDADGEKPLGQLLVTGDRAYPTMYLAGGDVYRLGIPRPAAALTLAAAAGAQLQETEGRAWSADHIAAAPARYGSESDALCGIIQDSDTAKVEVLSRATLIEEGESEEEDNDTPITDSGIQRSTAYVYTYVQMLAGGVIQYESAPSPASEVIDVLDGDGVTLTGFALPDLEGLTVTHIRLYRTVSGLESSEFRLVVEIPVEELEAADWQYTDALHDKDVSTEVLQTST